MHTVHAGAAVFVLLVGGTDDYTGTMFSASTPKDSRAPEPAGSSAPETLNGPLVARELVERVAALGERSRTLVGICGAPGAGKTTLAKWLQRQLQKQGLLADHFGADGFHLADSELSRLGLLGVKGRIDTFDGYGYSALLGRIRRQTDHVVYAPSFERDLEQPLAGAIPVFAKSQVVVLEGNYLLAPIDPWRSAREFFDLVVHCSVDGDLRRRRLTDRHVKFGKDPHAAARWVEEVDEPNAVMIERAAGGADVLVDLSDVELEDSQRRHER